MWGKDWRENFPLALKKTYVCNQIVSISIFYCLQPLRANNSPHHHLPYCPKYTLCVYLFWWEEEASQLILLTINCFSDLSSSVIMINSSCFTWLVVTQNVTEKLRIMDTVRHLLVTTGYCSGGVNSYFETKPVNVENKRPLVCKARIDIHNAVTIRLNLFSILNVMSVWNPTAAWYGKLDIWN